MPIGGNTKGKDRRPVEPEAALMRMADLCSRSEQCSADIAAKLTRMGLTAAQSAEVMAKLRTGKFLDDARFARAFCSDKVRFSGWGPLKIKAALFLKRIPAETVREAMEAVGPEPFEEAALKAALAKGRRLDLTVREERVKLLRHLASRGFSAEEARKAATAAARKIAAEREGM